MITTPFVAPQSITDGDLSIRCYGIGDAAALREATVRSYEHLRPWMPWATEHDTLEAAEARCRRFLGNYLLNNDFVLGIWQNGELCGGTGFHLRWGPMEHGIAEIGMWIHGQAAGQGLGTRALALMVRWGFQDWGWKRLVWQCDTRNTASARIAAKNGFTLEGTLRSNTLDVHGQWRDTYLFALLHNDWLAQGHAATV